MNIVLIPLSQVIKSVAKSDKAGAGKVTKAAVKASKK